MLDLILKIYNGNIKVHKPLTEKIDYIPKKLLDLLRKSNGISDIFKIPNTECYDYAVQAGG